MKMGDKIKFDGERQRYTVQAATDQFIIATKPFNARSTYLYTVVDRQRKVRGRVGFVFGLPCDVDSQSGADKCLRTMAKHDVGVSHRNYKELTPGEIGALCNVHAEEVA